DREERRRLAGELVRDRVVDPGVERARVTPRLVGRVPEPEREPEVRLPVGRGQQADEPGVRRRGQEEHHTGDGEEARHALTIVRPRDGPRDEGAKLRPWRSSSPTPSSAGRSSPTRSSTSSTRGRYRTRSTRS